jgi:periplasmic protein TonB
MNQISLKTSLLALTFFFSGYCFLAAQSPVSTNTDTSGTIVFTKVDKPAEFPGSIQGWSEYLKNNLKYPEKAIRKNIQGVVRVQFLVDKAGNISEVVALNNPGGGLAEESVRIIANGPKWKPAEQNGKKVIYRHIQAITFKLE